MNARKLVHSVWKLGIRKCPLPLSPTPLLSSLNNIFNNKLDTYPCITQTRSIKMHLSRTEVENKVLSVCSAYDKIQADKLTLDSSFIKDLGLDSLDHIEVIMEIENEFRFEISDVDAEKLHTPRDIVEHVCNSIKRVEPVA
uniref:Acyl carrier protein n=1 Tax=Schistosoma japonicum TaxID=6182 RepID=C1L726_SCHJA|nr:Phosphopantetheine-binding,domain-containing protein [Schistosoma japonicum]